MEQQNERRQTGTEANGVSRYGLFTGTTTEWIQAALGDGIGRRIWPRLDDEAAFVLQTHADFLLRHGSVNIPVDVESW